MIYNNKYKIHTTTKTSVFISLPSITTIVIRIAQKRFLFFNCKRMNQSILASQQVITNAVIIKCCVPDQIFDEGLALWCAGMNVYDARKLCHQTEVSNRLDAVRREQPIVINEDSISNLIERAKILSSHARRVPRKINKNDMPSIDNIDPTEKGSTSVADYFSLAGFSPEMLQGSNKPQYHQVYKFRSKYIAGNVPALTSTSPSFSHFDQRPLQQRIRIDCIDMLAPQSLMSPLNEEEHIQAVQEVIAPYQSSDSIPHQLVSPSSGPSSTISSLSNHGISLDVQPDTIQQNATSQMITTSNTNASTSTNLSSFSSKRSTHNIDFSRKVNDTVSRNTSRQANRQRHDAEAWEMLRESAYETSTKMYARLRNKKLPLTKFSSAESIASFVNEGFECELISGEMIRQAFKKNIIGKAPQKAGRRPTIPREDTDMLASLIFSANSIDQANSDPNRMDRPAQISTIGRIVNSKREEQGYDMLDDCYFSRNTSNPN